MRNVHCGVQVTPSSFYQGKSNGWDTKQMSFHRCCHRPGVEGIIAQVSTIIDAGNNEIRLEIKHAGESNMHTIRRRPINKIVPKVSVIPTQGYTKSQDM